MVSYEVSIGLVIVTVLLCVGSLNLNDIVHAQAGGITHWYVCSGLFPMFIVFFISCLAETNRLPFDLPEAEGELVAGYNVEYSSMAFALFFLGEYMNMILVSAMTTVLFLGGWYAPFGAETFAFIPGGIWFILKICLCLFVFLWVRATFPRYRYDQLMRLGWKVFLPLSLLWVVLTAGYLVYTGTLPNNELHTEQRTENNRTGLVTLEKDGTLNVIMDLRSVREVDLSYKMSPKDSEYQDEIDRFEPISRGESKHFEELPGGSVIYSSGEGKHEHN